MKKAAPVAGAIKGAGSRIDETAVIFPPC